MAVRVLRLIEYVYETDERAADDMARWTHSLNVRQMVMRSAVLPFESVQWDGEPFTPMDPIDRPADDGVPWKD